jgi:hypothetical protein
MMIVVDLEEYLYREGDSSPRIIRPLSILALSDNSPYVQGIMSIYQLFRGMQDVSMTTPHCITSPLCGDDYPANDLLCC